MSYILVVNPQILGQAGMPVEDVVLATVYGAAIATLLMGLLADYPFALAPATPSRTRSNSQPYSGSACFWA